MGRARPPAQVARPSDSKGERRRCKRFDPDLRRRMSLSRKARATATNRRVLHVLLVLEFKFRDTKVTTFVG